VQCQPRRTRRGGPEPFRSELCAVHSEIHRYQATGSAVSNCCNAEVSLSVLTHPSVHEAEVSIWSPHSSITGTFGRIFFRLCAKSKLACSLPVVEQDGGD
jgi:hypothetical protein